MRIILLAVAALAVTAGTAAPGHAAVRLGLRLESAVVIPGGTAVDVHYVVVCPPGTLARVAVSLAQRAGAHVAVGSKSADIVCNGVPRSVRMRVDATGGGLSFQPGPARAATDLRVTTGVGVRADDDRIRLVVMRR
ncbi:hypothetical protein GCM10010172_70250 [Paractinoplanes ferrugineus]|uniref:Uncharacterized protein n=1 Tax=Paractinoplanes ferrugineus TaxID=113564 RepID=A0A919J8A0_9ACTN|nr:hypothetical protein [Actinoplanes ferrugineus]GIE12396.1 hypothetical protein Afe05nite_42360 [Actinoplanes ferrugineus]